MDLIYMEKFESQAYRKELAGKLRQTREEKSRKPGQALLEKERETIIYKASRMLTEIKRSLPNEYLSHLNKFIHSEENDSLSQTFEINDISNELGLKHRLVIESEIIENLFFHYYLDKEDKYPPSQLTDKLHSVRELLFPGEAERETWGIKSGPELFDKVSDGSLSNNHNLTHVVLGQKHKQPQLLEPFNPDSMITGSPSYNLHFCAGFNPYAQQIDKSLVILSPKNLASRKFIEGFLNYNDIHGRVFIEENERGDIGYGYGSKDLYHSLSPWQSVSRLALLFLADYPIIEDDMPLPIEGKEIKWCDIATRIVNLSSGKLYNRIQTQQEIEEVQKSIGFYKNLAKKELGDGEELTSSKEYLRNTLSAIKKWKENMDMLNRKDK